ncbi:MAG: restriction endonuclease [Roseivirga sp.]|nr:restriction endonuclease [Roseivirga sp.]
MAVYQVYEYNWLQYEPGLRGHQPWFEQKHYECLVDFHDNRGGSRYFELVRSGIRFLQFVGVIQVRDLTIEILPKTDRSNDKNLWHEVLVSMLRQTRFLNLEYLSEASLQFKKHSILHLYFAEYLGQVRYLLQQGLVKQYHKKQGNLKALKGAIDFGRQVSQNHIHKERFYTRHQVYDHNHLLNQILREALLVLRGLTRGQNLADDVNRLLHDFPQVHRTKVDETTFKNLAFNRKNNSYKKAIMMAKMIILNYSPNIKGGSNELFALLFDMNELWEEFIYRQLLKAGAKVRYQDWDYFWADRTLIPDMVVDLPDDKIVIDTKWKIIDNAKPSTADLRQIFAYNIYWQAQKGYLLYPKTSQSPYTTPGEYHQGHSRDSKMTCQVIYADIVNENGLNQHIGQDILSQI